MQRFLVALFAVFALLAISFPAVAATSQVVRRETNGDRLRRGESILTPRNLRRHGSQVDTAKRSTASQGSTTPPPSGTVQCRNGAGKAIGYLTQTWTLASASKDGVTCNFVGGVLSVIGGTATKVSSIIGAVVGAVLSNGSKATVDLIGVTSSNNAVTWSFNSLTAGLNATYVNGQHQAVPCNAFYNETSTKIIISPASQVDGLVAVTLHLI